MRFSLPLLFAFAVGCGSGSADVNPSNDAGQDAADTAPTKGDLPFATYWVRLSNGGGDYVAITVEPDGSILAAGNAAGSIDFGGAVVPSTEPDQAYLARLGADGTVSSIVRFDVEGGPTNPYAIISNGATIVVSGSTTPKGQVIAVPFVAAFDHAGVMKWSRLLDWPKSAQQPSVYPQLGFLDGAVIVGDYVEQFGVGANGPESRNTMIFTRFDLANGDPLASRTFADVEASMSIAADGIHVAAVKKGGSDFGPTTSDPYDLVIARLDGSFAVTHASITSGGSDGTLGVGPILPEATGDFVTGRFSLPITLGSTPLDSGGENLGFIATTTNDGAISFAEISAREDLWNAYAPTDAGRVLVGGKRNLTVIDAIDAFRITAMKGTDVVYAWTAPTAVGDLLAAVRDPSSNAAIVAGSTVGAFDLGTGTMKPSLPGDVFVAKILP